eukprot:COSAG01_NODE_64324_length_277_cov_0.561798_1_plen_64_part_10
MCVFWLLVGLEYCEVGCVFLFCEICVGGCGWGGGGGALSYSNVGHGSQIIPMWVGLAISDACIV